MFFRFFLPWLLLPVIEGSLQRQSLRRAVGKTDAFSSLAAWLKANGASVHEGLEIATKLHGEVSVRGVVSQIALTSNDTVVGVPEKLWLTADNFPEIRDANLTGLGNACSRLDPEALDLLRSVTVVALETKRGDASFYSPYIRTLPAMNDFQSFYPMFGQPLVFAEFGALPVVKKVEGLLGYDFLIEQCFEAWRDDPSFPGSRQGAPTIEWSTDIKVALAQWRTRSYAVGQKSAMVPISDLGNTASVRSLNAQWSIENGRFFLRTFKPVPAMDEVVENYCDVCDNDYMLFAWGIYLEDNKNRLAQAEPVDCMASIPSEAGSAHHTLQEAAMSVLDMGAASLDKLAEESLTAPLCQPAQVSDGGQGPLRCNLARLAWEYCARDWRRHAADSAGAANPKAVVSTSASH